MIPAPIPTRYKGYHFRSRLEARWAVCFDDLGIHWLYEDEGYVLPSGSYLPDFKIDIHPAESVFVEIKGAAPTKTDFALCAELAQAACSDVWLFQGSPSDTLCHVWLFSRSIPRQYAYGQTAFVEAMKRLADPYDVWPDEMKFDWFRVMKAGAKARSARFEHGQSGPT